ncbi:TerB family tellurite resistance protein [Mucilaginibacter sp. CAU 1740]|uniref:TerB family tellurite resistance protein n=1 Tax=Mucilaginibacter sp. CAU 1740 TaxID=3140365 RepID=UPI00325C0AE5
MKKQLKFIVLGLAFACSAPLQSRAQSVADCIEQLVLDYQKLAGLKSVLSQMHSGYEVLSKGYGAVKNVSQGNFSLHQAFLDGLLLVSPAVRKYPRVADIISDQATLFSEYKNAAKRFNSSGRFSPEELQYLSAVYSQLVDASLKSLDQLGMVMSDSQLRMSDAERLAAIDRIFLDSRNQLSYLRKFNDQAGQTVRLREKSAGDKQTINSLYGINP